MPRCRIRCSSWPMSSVVWGTTTRRAVSCNRCAPSIRAARLRNWPSATCSACKHAAIEEPALVAGFLLSVILLCPLECQSSTVGFSSADVFAGTICRMQARPVFLSINATEADDLFRHHARGYHARNPAHHRDLLLVAGGNAYRRPADGIRAPDRLPPALSVL